MSDRDQRFSTTQQAAPQPQLEEQEDNGYIIENPSVVYPLQKKSLTTPVAKHKLHLLSGYCEYPDEVYFHDQEPEEVILLFLRRSQIVNIPWIITSIILLFLPFLLFFLPLTLLPFTIPFNFLVLLFLYYYLFVFTFVFVNFVIWYYNAALITNKRIVDIDFHQLIYKDIAETKLSLVQDVSYRQSTVVENLFDFGHVLVQTAGTIDNFEFDSLPKPERIEEIVNELIGKGRVYIP